MTKNICEWTLEDADYGTWSTSCDNMIYVANGTPAQNGWLYCPYCGHRIETVELPSEDE